MSVLLAIVLIPLHLMPGLPLPRNGWFCLAV